MRARGGSRLFDAKQDPLQRFVSQHVAGANTHHPHPSFRKPCLAALIVVNLRDGVVC
jgi:hypothetical protein